MMCPSGGEAPLTGTVNSMEGEPYRSFKGRMFFGEGSSTGTNSIGEPIRLSRIYD